MPTLVMLNRQAGGGRAARLQRPMEQWLAQHAPGTELALPTSVEQARERLRQLPKASRVIVVGGDGTLNQLLAALLEQGHTLGLVACGSGNDTARALGLHRVAWADALAHALQGQPRAMDVGQARFDVNGATACVPFLSSFTVGFDSSVGLRALTGRLAWIKQLGFDVVYLMPWHRGGYGTIDYTQIEPGIGTLDDLRCFCDAAHAEGLRVLFDLLLVIAADGSPYMAEHPDWFYRDASGKVLPHPVWQGHCFDPASPGFRRFLIDYAVRCCAEWGADGFRVDSSAHRGGLWHSPLGLQPHEHSYAVFTLLSDLRAAIRAVKSEAALLMECFGPQQTPIGDLVGFQWIIWLDWFMTNLNEGRFDGAAVQRLIGEHFLSMPRDTWLTTYTHTHDTLAFSKRDPEGPAISALFGTLALLSAGVMVFGGGWGMHARPRPDEEAEYRALFAAKARLGGVASHEVRFQAAADPALFVAERPSALGPVSVVTNFSGEVRRHPLAGTALYSRLGSPAGQILPYDILVSLGR